MRKIAGKRIMVCIGTLALCIGSPLLHAQIVLAQPVDGALAPAQPAQIVPRKDGLTSMAAYAEKHKGLTADQFRIGYELCGGLGPYRPDCPQKADRALLLKLIKQTRDSLNFGDFMGTPLTVAAKRGDAEIVTAIMAKGISLNMPNAAVRQIDVALEEAVFGLTVSVSSIHPPFWGPPEGYLETIHLLLNAGASPQKNQQGSAPLGNALGMGTPDAASKKIRLEVVQLLLDHGADPNALSVAVYLSDDPVLNLLMAHGLELKKSQSTELLVAAVQYQNHAMVKMALAKGADPDVRPDGNGALITVADEESVKLLLAAGANPKVCKLEAAPGMCAPYGQPMIFMFPKNPELLRLMIANGANPDGVDAQGNTVLGNALARGTIVCPILDGRPQPCLDDAPQRAAAAITLLKAGADPNKRSQGKLPLMQVQDSDHEVITLLLDKGAHMESASVGPVSMAMATKRPFLAGELLRRSHGKLGSDEKWALFLAARDGNVAVAEGLAQHGANLDAQAPFGETALHYAAARGDATVVKRLLSLGANPNLQTEAIAFSRTEESLNPLVIAAAYARMKMHMGKEQEYRSAGLEPLEFRDQVEFRYGNVTPLMLAAASGNVEAARALLDGGAKATLKSESGYTAQDTAQNMRNSQMVQLLAGHR